jgi:hypothetical protein
MELSGRKGGIESSGMNGCVVVVGGGDDVFFNSRKLFSAINGKYSFLPTNPRL